MLDFYDLEKVVIHEVEYKTRFSIGEEVVDLVTGRRGRVSNIWIKPVSQSAANFSYQVQYTVKPEKKYNQFRVNENELGHIVLDENDNEKFITHQQYLVMHPEVNEDWEQVDEFSPSEV